MLKKLRLALRKQTSNYALATLLSDSGESLPDAARKSLWTGALGEQRARVDLDTFQSAQFADKANSELIEASFGGRKYQTGRTLEEAGLEADLVEQFLKRLLDTDPISWDGEFQKQVDDFVRQCHTGARARCLVEQGFATLFRARLSLFRTLSAKLESQESYKIAITERGPRGTFPAFSLRYMSDMLDSGEDYLQSAMWFKNRKLERSDSQPDANPIERLKASFDGGSKLLRRILVESSSGLAYTGFALKQLYLNDQDESETRREERLRLIRRGCKLAEQCLIFIEAVQGEVLEIAKERKSILEELAGSRGIKL